MSAEPVLVPAHPTAWLPVSEYRGRQLERAGSPHRMGLLPGEGARSWSGRNLRSTRNRHIPSLLELGAVNGLSGSSRAALDAFKKLERAHIGKISLTTNRRPNAAIATCLGSGRIPYARITEPKRSTMIAEPGSPEDRKTIFVQFYIRHRDKGYLALEHETIAHLRSHGTPIQPSPEWPLTRGIFATAAATGTR